MFLLFVCYYPSGLEFYPAFSFLCEVLRLGKVIVCGKGGSGKSTVTALLARYLVVSGRSVCVIDADESNTCLYRMVDLPHPGRTLAEELGGRPAIVKNCSSVCFDETNFPQKLHVKDLPCSCTSCRDNLYLVSIGKIKEMGEGCSCVMTDLAKQFISMLYAGSWTYLIDTGSSMEHIGRSLYDVCDAFLMVIDGTWESLELAVKMKEFAERLNKKIYWVLNKVKDSNLTFMAKALEERGLKPQGVVPYISLFEEAALRGNPLPLQKEVIRNIESLASALAFGSQLESAFITSCMK
ncbi:hypothetical protein Tlie_0390 [Thermovirga lienii DSM 17291]|uniref:CobQ/CobB/MinD/ParA nucleotide binding domain-containing protein n=1 Tax=Thermovirga lienii (strain ATCC BAA-1197 / DSM 17291 / Cas60314) TaxID=580340 RepID=G7V791_THELD|nr:hypothetical protein Tlie_0390 [Thermovirga lienii DSM 17291]